MTILAQYVDDFIIGHGIRKSWIADKMGITQQLLYRKLNKKNFTIEDANEILDIIGYKIEYTIVKK